jgi:hypothetical protein
MTAFPLSEKELSVLVIVKKGHFFVKRGGGGGVVWIIFCYVYHALAISLVIFAYGALM